MADPLLNFRCPQEMIDAIDNLGQKRYPSSNANGCDRSKTLKDIIRAGIQALTDGAVVLQPVTQSDKTVLQTGLDAQQVKALITEVLQSSTSVLHSSKDVLQSVASKEEVEALKTAVENIQQQTGEAIGKVSRLGAEMESLKQEQDTLKQKLEAIATADRETLPAPTEPVTSSEQMTNDQSLIANDQSEARPAHSRLKIGLKDGLTQSGLAKRLGKNASNVARHRQAGNLESWSQQNDPDGLKWKFDRKLKRYFIQV